MDNFNNKKKAILCGIVFVFAIIVCLIYYNYRMSSYVATFSTTSKGGSKENKNLSSEDDIEQTTKETSTITVYVTGEVGKPGVYNVSPESRVTDVIEVAGGATENADLDKVNLAKYVDDGEKVDIPKEKEETVEKGSSIVNLNTATIEELMTLPGIGEVTAQNIIKYREENGGFKTKEEIKNVPRIGEKTYEEIESLIIVE